VKSPHLFTSAISTSETSLVSSNHTRYYEECARRMEALCTVHHFRHKKTTVHTSQHKEHSESRLSVSTRRPQSQSRRNTRYMRSSLFTGSEYTGGLMRAHHGAGDSIKLRAEVFQRVDRTRRQPLQPLSPDHSHRCGHRRILHERL
jgi:hypothetical protein